MQLLESTFLQSKSDFLRFSATKTGSTELTNLSNTVTG